MSFNPWLERPGRIASLGNGLASGHGLNEVVVVSKNWKPLTMSKTSISHRIISGWDKLQRKPGGKWLFSLLIGRFVPYSGSIGASVQELRPGFARLTLRDRRKVRNHLGSFHAIALANLGELTTGLAIMAGMPSDARGILRGLEVSYDKKARGLLTSECMCDLVSPETNTEYSIQAQIRDQAGDVVSVVTALWVIGPQKGAV